MTAFCLPRGHLGGQRLLRGHMAHRRLARQASQASHGVRTLAARGPLHLLLQLLLLKLQLPHLLLQLLLLYQWLMMIHHAGQIVLGWQRGCQHTPRGLG